MKTEMKLGGLDAALRMLEALPKEVVSRKGSPTKEALRRGALVILRQERANLQAALSNQTSRERQEDTGLLMSSLIVTGGKAKPGLNATFLVRVKRKAYLRKGKGALVTTLKTAALMETGSSHQAAEPWVRPAVAAKGGEALQVITSELVKGIDQVAKKLAR